MSDCFFNYTSATDLVTYSTNIGDGVNNVFVVPHNLGTKDVSVTVRDTQTNLLAYPAIEVITLSSISVSFNFVPALTAYDVTIFAATSAIRVEPFSDRVVINIDEQPAQNVTVSVSSVGESIVINASEFATQWGTITGILSTQTDLWYYLSADSDAQTLTYVTSSYLLSISNGNTINLSSINSTFAANSGKYESVYSIVQSNSASWEESADIIPTVTNYLSTSNILISSLNILNGLSATPKLTLNTVNASAVPQIYFNEYLGNGTGSIFTYDGSRTQASPPAPEWGIMFAGLNIQPNASGTDRALIDPTKGGASFTIENMWVTPTVNQPLAEFYTNVTDLCAGKTVRGFSVIGNQLSADLGFNTSTYPLQIAPAKGSLNGWYGQDATFYPLNVNYEVTNATAELARFNNPDTNSNASAAIYLAVQNESYKTIFLAKRDEFLIRNYPAGRNAFYLNSTGILLGSTNANAKAQAPVHAADSMLVSGNLSATGTIQASSVISRIPLVFTTLSAYTLSLADQSDLITINNSLTSFVYIPNDSSVNFGDGSQINISRLGSGTVTISALGGVTLRSADNRNQLRTQNSTATIVKLSANDWLLFGDIS